MCLHAALSRLQVIRVVRLVRLVKLFKYVDLHGKAAASDSPDARKSPLSRFSPNIKQSHVGQKLTELTTKRVVLGVLSMVLVLPFLDVSNTIYGEKPAYAAHGLRQLHRQGVLDDTSPLFTSALAVRSPQCMFVAS
jgi:hypothetical protein